MMGRDITGVIVPIVTPLTEDDAVDHEGFRHLVRYVLEGGVNGVFVFGGTGNFCSFGPDERVEGARVVVDEVDGRVPVWLGCTDSNTRLVLECVRRAADTGVDGIVVESPYYFPCTEEETIAHYRAISEASRLPVIAYNVPVCNKVEMTLEMIRRLAQMPNLVGIKDSTGDFVSFQAQLAAFSGSGFRVIQRLEELVGASLLFGAGALILFAANVMPDLCARLFQAGSSGDLGRTRDLHGQLMAALDAFTDHRGDPGTNRHYGRTTMSSFYGGLECALDILGLCRKVTTAPYPPPSPGDYERVRTILERLQIAS